MNNTSWICKVCDEGNHITDTKCVNCGCEYGTESIIDIQKDDIDGWE